MRSVVLAALCAVLICSSAKAETYHSPEFERVSEYVRLHPAGLGNGNIRARLQWKRFVKLDVYSRILNLDNMRMYACHFSYSLTMSGKIFHKSSSCEPHPGEGPTEVFYHMFYRYALIDLINTIEGEMGN